VGASHVLIRGQVFTYAEKAPFVASGQSVMGAIEFDQEADTCRCHECGEFIRGLGNHIKRHGLQRQTYNLRHGLRRNGRLGSPTIAAKHRLRVVGNNNKAIRMAIAAIRVKRPTMPKFVHSAETANLNARCQAQLIFQVQMLALRVGHSPTHPELRAAGISASAIRHRFGGIPELCGMAGLQPNMGGDRRGSPLPRDFPNKEEIRKKFDERMPWPEDYFGLHVSQGSHLN
jgi:hypothetical protein